MFNNKFTKKDPVVDVIADIIKEEPQQVDELSVPTMGSYFQKSLHQTMSGKKDRTAGMQKAYKKMTTKKTVKSEEVEQIDELSFDKLDAYKKKVMAGGKSIEDLSSKRQKGITLAHRKVSQSLSDNPKGKYAKVGATFKGEETELSFKDYLIDNFKNSLHDIEQIDEKEMSPAQQKKKEEIVLSMKDKQKEFKAKYGKRWKEVMYATATKMAMKEETLDEKWDDEDDDVARADRELARMKAKPIPAAKINTDKDKIKKTAKDKEEEMDESVDFDEIYESYECFEEVEQIDEISRDLAKRYISKTKPEYSTPKEIAKRSAGRGLALKKVWGDKKYGLDEPKVKATEEVELQENYGDMSHAAKELVLHADNDHHLYHSSHQPIVKNLSKKMKKGVYHPEKAKKLWAYHADRAAQSYAKHHGDGTPWHKMFSTSDRKAAASHWEDMHRHELHEGKDPSMDAGCGSEQPFVTGANTTSSPMMKKIKEIACSSRNRIKSEMLGKAGATSEEVDPSVKSTDMLKGRVKGGKSDDVGPGADGKSTKIKFIPGPK